MQVCSVCGESFSRIGSHWYYNPDHRPELTNRQIEIATGVLMGDGWIQRADNTPSLQIKSITKEYLNWLNSEFGNLGTDVRLEISAEDNADHSRKTGLSPDADSNNYSDVYKWNTRSHPKFSEFEEWYQSGDKIWPEDLELTPMILKNLYCCDGTFDNYGTSFRIRISCLNEFENKEKINSMFSNIGFEVDRWIEQESYVEKYPNKKNIKIEFGAENTRKIFKYMGKPLPGFEYKWPETFITDTTE